MMEDQFRLDEWNTGRIFPLPVHDFRQVTTPADQLLANWFIPVSSLPVRKCRQVTLTADQHLANWCIPFFQAVDAHMAYTSVWTVDSARSEAHHRAVALKLLPSGQDNPQDNLPTPLAQPGWPCDGDDAELDEQRKGLIANMYRQYFSLELLMRPTLRRYSIPFIPSISEILKTVVFWLDSAAKEKRLEKDLPAARQETADITERATAAGANDTVL